MTFSTRAHRALRAMEMYRYDHGDEASQEDLNDLLTDLRHLAAEHPGLFNFDEGVDASFIHFDAKAV